MRHVLVAIVLMSSLSSSIFAAEVLIESKVASVAMFKNGLAVVKRTIEIPGPGVYVLHSVPEPVHGTFWIESDANVQTRVTQREVEVPLNAASAGMDFQKELANREVVIRMRDPGLGVITGRVIEMHDDQSTTWNREYESANHYGSYYYPWRSSGYAAVPPLQPVRYLLLETQTGRSYVDASMIASLEVTGTSLTVMRRKPAMVFTVESPNPAKPAPATIAISYLAKGMAWAPSYRIDTSDSTTLSLLQQAVIKNELEDVQDAELVLISGYPSIEFSHVTSPLSLRTNLASFFNQLGQSLRHSSRGSVVTQQAVMSNVVMPAGGDSDVPAIPEGEGVDLHFQSIGRHTMAVGDSLMLNIASGQAAYQRVVEWLVPDVRNEFGRLIDEYQHQQDPEKYDDAAWDALRFRNPLPFAMTTAPAMIVSGNRFNGQRTSFWTNTGEQTTLRVTKSLSIRTRAIEHEEPAEAGRPLVRIGYRDYRMTPVVGELHTTNHRAEPVTLVVRRRFSGELIEADGEPKNQFLEAGVYSVNRRNELTWTFTLEPGQERVLTYRYKVLVPH